MNWHALIPTSKPDPVRRISREPRDRVYYWVLPTERELGIFHIFLAPLTRAVHQALTIVRYSSSRCWRRVRFERRCCNLSAQMQQNSEIKAPYPTSICQTSYSRRAGMLPRSRTVEINSLWEATESFMGNTHWEPNRTEAICLAISQARANANKAGHHAKGQASGQWRGQTRARAKRLGSYPGHRHA